MVTRHPMQVFSMLVLVVGVRRWRRSPQRPPRPRWPAIFSMRSHPETACA
jgi:hypothetical protein